MYQLMRRSMKRVCARNTLAPKRPVRATSRALPMHFTKTLLVAAIILRFILTNVAGAATAPASARDPHAVVVEVSGNVPGFTPTQLQGYLASKMREESA